MTLESIGCKCNLTYINNYIKTAFLCAPSRQTHDWLCAEFHRRRSAYAVRQWMDACGGTPYIQDSSSNISSRKQSISNQRGMMKHGYLLYVHDESVTPKFPASQDISAFQCAVCAINVSITNALPPESREPWFNIDHSKIIWRMARSPHISPIAARVWFNSTHNLVTWGFRSPCTWNGVRRC